MAGRLPDAPRFWAWLPVVLLPPVLILDAALNPHEGKQVTLLAVVCTVVACLPLVLRSRLPFLVMAPLVTGSVLLVLWQLEPGDTVVLIPAVALADIAARSSRRRTAFAAMAIVPCVALGVFPFVENAGEFFSVTLRNVALCWLALAFGDAVRSRREAIEGAAEAGEERALRRLGEERLGIARDVHDVAGHAMAAINVQAGVAAHLMDDDPEQARVALKEIKTVSGEALTDLRATIGVLRDPEAGAPVEPAGGFGDLDELTGGLRAAGVRVEVGVDPLEDAPARVRTAAYRIVQEALTNVLRHASATSARVSVRYDGSSVRLEVADDGSGTSAAAGAGHGISGMRERAAALGGTLESGPAEGGGWRVAARLPVEVETSA